MTRKTILAGFSLLFLASVTYWAAGKSDVADAVMKRDKAALRTLLQQKADVNAAQIDGTAALHWAVYNNDAEMLDALIGAGAKVDVKNREGVTPLQMASQFGNAKVVDKLLKAGADPKQRGPAGETMLMLAARSGSPESVTTLIATGADVNARATVDDAGVGGQTAIFHAVTQFEDQGLPIVQLLVEQGADLSVRVKLPGHYERPDEVVECTPLGYALRFVNEPPSGRGSTVAFLRERGAIE